MDKLEISCSVREATGKGVARKLRRGGKIPGILYGGDRVVPLVLDPKEIQRVLSSQAGENAIVQLKISGETSQDRKVILRELQFDTIRSHLLHVDLYQIAMDEELEVHVPVELVGVPAGVDEGGVLTQQLYDLHVKCLPDQIPDRLSLDVSDLEIGDGLRVSDLSVPGGVTILDDLDAPVVAVAAPRVEVEVEEEEVDEEEVEEEVDEEAAEEKKKEEPAAE
ncbi:MAG: 50S ribosomal protein L25 [bacterium]|nr:50S ribosomal protein L25 [bacterium]